MARESGQGRGLEERIRRSKEERRRIVEATIGTGISVARVARAHGVNANQVYAWRRLYEKGLLGRSGNHAALVPVRLTEAVPAAPISVPSTGARRAPAW
jgi:transposase